jgi:hypothetical protein
MSAEMAAAVAAAVSAPNPEMDILEMDMRLIIRALLRSRMSPTIPRHLIVLLQMYHFNLDGSMGEADLKHLEPRADLVDQLAAALEPMRPASDLVDECLEALANAKDLIGKLR